MSVAFCFMCGNTRTTVRAPQCRARLAVAVRAFGARETSMDSWSAPALPPRRWSVVSVEATLDEGRRTRDEGRGVTLYLCRPAGIYGARNAASNYLQNAATVLSPSKCTPRNSYLRRLFERGALSDERNEGGA